ncbi:MAG: hypothetical protein AAF764_03035 [Pseudomonadota bacterium]
MARPTSNPHLHTKTGPTRRTVLTGTAAALASTALMPGLSGSASAAVSSAPVATGSFGPSAVCAAHHKELSNHLRTILNSAYVDETMKNKVLSTSHCPHCRVAIKPADMDRAAFSVIA